MADGVDLILEHAQEASGERTKFLTEQSQAEAAQDDFSALAQENIQESIQDLQGLQESHMLTAATKSEAYADMATTLERLDELNSMPGLASRVLEPIASLFDPNWDRQKLAGDLASSRAKVAIADDQQAMRRRDVELRQARRAEELKSAAVNKETQEQDVANLALRGESRRVFAAELAAYRTDFMASASQAELDEAVRSGFITQKDARRAVRAERMEQLRMNEAEFRSTLRRVQSLKQDELEAIAMNPDHQMSGVAQDEVVRRKSRELRMAAAENAALDYRVQNATNAQLAAMLADNRINQRQHDQELNRRESQELSLKSQRQAVAANDAALAERHRVNYARNMSNRELDVAIEAAGETGKVTVQGMDYTIDELTEVRQGRLDIQTKNAIAAVQKQSAQASLSSASYKLGRTTGQNVDPTQHDPMSLYKEWAQDPNIDPMVRQAATELVALDAILAQENLHDSQQALLLEEAATRIEAITQAQQQAELATKSQPYQQAHQEWMNTGTVQDSGAAIEATGFALGTQQSTGSPVWDAVLEGLQGQLAVIQQQDPRLVAESITAEPSTFLAPILADPALKQAALQNVNAQASIETWKRAALKVGDEQLVAMLGNPGSDIWDNGVFDTRRLIDMVKARPEGHPHGDINQLLQAARSESRIFAKENFQTVGKQGGLQASLNMLLFDNQAHLWFPMSFDRNVHGALKQSEAMSRGGVPPSASVDVGVAP